MKTRLTIAAIACSILFGPAFAEEAQSVHMQNFQAGQAAEARGDYDAALALYQKAADQYEDLEAQELADDALMFMAFADLEDSPKHRISDRSFAYLSGKAKGMDGLVDPDDASGIDTTDTAFDMMLAGTINLWSSDKARLAASGNLYREDYVDYSEFDLRLIGASLQYDHVFGDNLMKFQVGASSITLGGQDYISYSEVSLSDTIFLGPEWDLKVSGNYRDITSDNPEYDHYEGNSFGVGIELRGRDDNPWRLDYSWRSDDAADDYVQFTNENDEVFDGFLSYSRDYHRIRGRYEHTWNDKLSQTFSASYRKTKYHDSNLFLEYIDDTTLTEVLRDGTRYSIGTELSWSITDKLRILGDIEFYNEDSNIDQYDFDSLQFGIGVDYFF